MPFIENSENPIVDLSFNFGVRIVKFYKYLTTKNVYVLSKQILRCGTSIGANVHESIHAQSKADFISKMNIALKEADETDYWLRLLWKSDVIEDEEYESLSKDVKQIIGTLVKIIKNTKSS
jgi:four helix bundle protein